MINKLNEEEIKSIILKGALQDHNDKIQKKQRAIARVEIIKQKLKDKANKPRNDNNDNTKIPVDLELKPEDTVYFNTVILKAKCKELFSSPATNTKPEPLILKSFQSTVSKSIDVSTNINSKPNIEDTYRTTDSMDVFGMKSITNRKIMMKNNRLMTNQKKEINIQNKLVTDNLKNIKDNLTISKDV